MPARILYVTFKTMAPGQAGHVHVARIIAGWGMDGHAVTLIGPRGNGRIFDLVSIHVRLVLALLSNEWKAVYVRGNLLAAFAVLMARMFGQCVIVETNGIALELFSTHLQAARWYKLWRSAERVQLRAASAVVAVTEKLRQFHRWHDLVPGQRISVVGNGADTEKFSACHQQGRESNKRVPYVVFVGELQRWQGLRTILEAWLLMRGDARRPDLVIAGSGVLAGEVAAAAARDPGIRWLGAVPHDRVPALLSEALAALAVMGANVRNVAIGLSPIKLFEYMAAGTPVIASDLPGIREIVKESRGGLLVPPDDPVALAAAVRTLLAERGHVESMGYSGRAWVLACADWRHRARDAYRVIDAATRMKRHV